MAHRTLKVGDVVLAKCSIFEPVCQAVNDWFKQRHAEGFTNLPNRSEISFTGSSMRTLRDNAASLKQRPVIVARDDIHLDENMKTLHPTTVFVMATFDKQPVSNLPALYRHFVRHTNSPDTARWPEGKDAIRILPHMPRPNQYVLAISFIFPPGTKIWLFGASDQKVEETRHAVCAESIGDLGASYLQLLKELPPELASARVAKAQAKLLKDWYSYSQVR